MTREEAKSKGYRRCLGRFKADQWRMWQPFHLKKTTPEQRSERARRGWETRRANQQKREATTDA